MEGLLVWTSPPYSSLSLKGAYPYPNPAVSGFHSPILKMRTCCRGRCFHYYQICYTIRKQFPPLLILESDPAEGLLNAKVIDKPYSPCTSMHNSH